MAFTYEKPANAAGDWVNMRDLAKLGEVLVTEAGFLIDDATNVYKGEGMPRYIVQAKVKSTGDAVKVSCPKGYGRDGFFEALSTYLEEHEGETVDIRFAPVAGSNYIDVDTV